MAFSERNNCNNVPDFLSIWNRDYDVENSFSIIIPERHRNKMHAKGNRGHHHNCFEENVDRRINKLEHVNRALRAEVREYRRTIEGLRASQRKNEKMLYIGLIINEIVTNSLKHAFPGEEAGTVCIDLKRSDPHSYILTVKDNGTGFKSGKESDDYNPVGLKLIESMVNQLKGTLEFNRENGMTVKVTFPMK